MKQGKSKQYNNDFKRTVVELYHTGSSVSSLSSEYGVSEVTIYKWIKALTPISQEASGLTPQDIAEIQKENLRLKQEVEILKKAMTIFAKNNRCIANQIDHRTEAPVSQPAFVRGAGYPSEYVLSDIHQICFPP